MPSQGSLPRIHRDVVEAGKMWLEKWKVLVICSLAKKNGGLGATQLRDLGGRVVGEGCRTKMKMLCTLPKADLGSPGKGFLTGEAAAISACQDSI